MVCWQQQELNLLSGLPLGLGERRGAEEKRVTVSPFRFSLLLLFLETLDTQANKRHASKVELEYV